jgi:transcriptional regulator with XRE-family HTH domain
MARMDAGLTISELAERAGVSRDTISNAEKGRHGLQASTLYKIARALGKAPSELLAEEERLAPKARGRSSLELSFNDVLAEERRIDFEACASALDAFTAHWGRGVAQGRPLDRQAFADYVAAMQGIAPMLVEISRAERELLGIRTNADRERSVLWPAVSRFVRVARGMAALAEDEDAAAAVAGLVKPLAA